VCGKNFRKREGLQKFEFGKYRIERTQNIKTSFKHNQQIFKAKFRNTFLIENETIIKQNNQSKKYDVTCIKK